MRRALCAVALLALGCLLVRAVRVGLAGDYVDPIGKITAQDEALYAHSAIAMAHEGDWLTPHFMGRFALYKPPLLIWGAAVSTKIFGVSRIGLRLPGMILCALAVGLIFLWAAEIAGWQAGAIAAALLITNHLFYTLATLCMTDAFLIAFYIAALYAVYCDPWLESRAGLWGFSGAVAAAILTKGIAGLLPLGVLGIYWLAARPKERSTFARLFVAAGLAFALASPWFVYQLVVHYRWFWTEHIAVEILGYGAGAPPQTSRESQAAFYFMRLAVTDPVLLALAFTALPTFFGDLRRRTSASVLVAVWIIVMAGAVLVWQYRNASYLLPLVPAMVLLIAGWSPFATGRFAAWMGVGIAAVFLLKATGPNLPWGLNAQAGTVQPLAPALSSYCEQARGNTLVVVDLADDLYASVLPLARLRYAALMPIEPAAGPYSMPFRDMGIMVTVAEFNDLARFEPAFRDRLRQWGIDSAAPIATLITPRSREQLAGLVVAHPEIDFVVPAAYRDVLLHAPQARVDLSDRFFFLLSRMPQARASMPGWTCRL